MTPGQNSSTRFATEELQNLRPVLLGGLDGIGQSISILKDESKSQNTALATDLEKLLSSIQSTRTLVDETLSEGAIASPPFAPPVQLVIATSQELASIARRHSDSADLSILDTLQLQSAAAEKLNSGIAPLCTSSAGQSSTIREQEIASPIAGGHLMIVDDQEEIRELLQIRLEQLGCRVTTAPTGEDALELAASNPPDLVLLDVSMPGMNGYEVCERLHALESTINVPVIFLTATHDPDKIVQGFESGGVDYIGKPFRMTELIARVRTHLDLKRARDTVEHYAARMTVLNRQKDKFMQIATHDLRNPLSNVQFCCRQLSEGNDVTPADESQRRLIARVQSETVRMLDIVENILGFRKTIDGDLQLELKPLDVGQFVEEAIGIHCSRAQARSIRLSAEIPTRLSRIRGDSARCQQVLGNFISNALKYCASGSRIVVRAASESDQIRISVHDNGPGVPAAERDELFREFAQLSNQPAAGEYSTGIGLAIARRLTEAQGGTVGAEFPETGGSVFWFALPTRK